jgi:hypothetical protein
VVLKFAENSQLTVLGNFDVNGTETEPVIFTSIKDDSVSGDTNSDGAATLPSRSDRWGVDVGNWRASEAVLVNISHAEFRYTQDGLWISQADSVIENIHFATTGDGLYTYLGTVILKNFSAVNMYRTALTLDHVYAHATHVSVVGSNYNAIEMFGSTVAIENITLNNIRRHGVDIYQSDVSMQGLVSENSALLNGSSDVINIFESDAHVHEVNITDSMRGPAIGVYASHATVTDAVLINGSGTGVMAYGWSTASRPTRMHLDNVTAENFLDSGAILINSTVSILDSSIENNYIGIESYFDNTDEGFVIENSSITGNTMYGVLDYGSVITPKATENWWGDDTGPYHETDNPDGLGDQIEGEVDFSDWLITPPNTEEEIDPLLLQYAPVLYMHPDEDYLPMNVEAFVEESALWNQSGIDKQLKTAEQLTFREFESIANNDDTSDYYLSFSDPDEAKSIDLTAAKTKYDALIANKSATTTVYAYKMEDSFVDDQGTQHEFTVLQYWYFYAMNNWKEYGGRNNHEGDWESVFIFLDKKTKEPVYIAYSAHHNDGDDSDDLMQYGSVRRSWNDDDIVFDNGRIVSFSSLGSHANYSNHNNGSHDVFGVDDLVSNVGQKINNKNIIDLSSLNDNWLTDYLGKWGADQVLPGSDGPQGPNFIDVGGTLRFHDPVAWAGLDQVASLTVSSPTSTFNFPSLGVNMQFSDQLIPDTELDVSVHDEHVSFGENVKSINFIPKFWDFETSLPNDTFDVTVTLRYVRDKLLQWGVAEEFLQVYFYNEQESIWEPVESKIDYLNEQVSFETNHFSRYAIGSPRLIPPADNVEIKTRLGKYNQSNDTREAFVTLHNKGTTTIRGDVRVVIRNIEDSRVKLKNASGVTNSGSYYVDAAADVFPGEKLTLPVLIFSLPTKINTAEQANDKAKKPNAEFKQFGFVTDLYILD